MLYYTDTVVCPWDHGPLLLGGCHERVEAKWSRCTETIESCKRLGKTCADVRWWEVQLGEGLLTGGWWEGVKAMEKEG